MINEASFWQLFWQQLINTSALEWVGTVTGFACIFLAAKQNILNWPVSLISILAYMILFYQYRLYGDAFLQGYFLIMAIYGWYYWKKRSTQHQKPVSVLKWHHYIIVVFASAALSLLAGYLLKNYTNSDVPYIDGFCTAVSLVAQFLMSRKILQNWLLWILVDACYVPLYIHKELMLTAVLYTLFLGIAAMGYLDWEKSWKETR